MTQGERRMFRRLLGLCYHCTEKAEPRMLLCLKHKNEHVETQGRYRDRQRKKRGWRLVRVKV